MATAITTNDPFSPYRAKRPVMPAREPMAVPPTGEPGRSQSALRRLQRHDAGEYPSRIPVRVSSGFMSSTSSNLYTSSTSTTSSGAGTYGASAMNGQYSYAPAAPGAAAASLGRTAPAGIGATGSASTTPRHRTTRSLGTVPAGTTASGSLVPSFDRQDSTNSGRHGGASVTYTSFPAAPPSYSVPSASPPVAATAAAAGLAPGASLPPTRTPPAADVTQVTRKLSSMQLGVDSARSTAGDSSSLYGSARRSSSAARLPASSSAGAASSYMPAMVPAAPAPAPLGGSYSNYSVSTTYVPSIGRAPVRVETDDSDDTNDITPRRPVRAMSASRDRAAGHDRSTSGVPRGLCGLQNLGNTCFMNSCLQCLSNTVPLRELFLRQDYTAQLCRRSSTKGKLAKAFGALLEAMWAHGARGPEQPMEVKRVVQTVAPRFIGYDQHDAQEFLRFFLDALHDDLNRIAVQPKYEELKELEDATDAQMSDIWWRNYCERNDSAVKDIFCGQLRSVVTCSKCGTKSRCFDPFWDISVPIPKRSQVRERRLGSALSFAASTEPTSTAAAGCSILSCLQEFCQPETLEGTESFYCGKCKAHQPSNRVISIFRAPKVLVLHIKRFSYSAFRREKLTTHIDFPLENLDVRPFCATDGYCKSNTLYKLVAVSNHMGGLGGGHYTANCQNSEDGKWYDFNDSRVSGCSQSHPVSGTNGYLLFYQQQSS